MAAANLSLLSVTVAATGTIATARLVTPAGAQCGADGQALGVARVAAVSGDKIAVDVLGTAVVEAGAAITLGATLKSDSSGRAITWSTSGARVGIALSAAGAAGDMIEALLIHDAT